MKICLFSAVVVVLHGSLSCAFTCDFVQWSGFGSVVGALVGSCGFVLSVLLVHQQGQLLTRQVAAGQRLTQNHPPATATSLHVCRSNEEAHRGNIFCVII